MITESRYNSTAQLNSVQTANLIITGRCDSRCGSCSYWYSGSEHLSLDYIKSILPSLNAANIKVIRLTGGEPTLHPQFIEIAQYIRKNSTAMLVLNSHGEHIEQMFPVIRHFFDAYIISLDSATQEGYHKLRGVDWFNHVIRLPQLVHSFRKEIFVAFSCVIQRENYTEMPSIINESFRSGANLVSFSVPNFKDGPYDNHFPRFDKQLNRMLLTEEQCLDFSHVLERVEGMREELPSGFVLQNRGTLLQYVNILQHWTRGNFTALPILTCGAPFTTIVVNEHGFVKPCFIHEEKYHLDSGGDAVNHEDLLRFRQHFSSDDERRGNVCRRCYVYPYVLSGQEF